MRLQSIQILRILRNALNCFRKLFGQNSFKPTTASLKILLLLKTSRTGKSTIAQRDEPDSQNWKQLFADISLTWCLCKLDAADSQLTYCELMNKHKIMDREIVFEKVHSKTMKFTLHLITELWVRPRKLRWAHGKIFKTTSVSNLSRFSNNFLKWTST